MWDIVITELRELAVTVLVALLSLGAAYAIAYIRRAQSALEARIENEHVERVLGRVWHLAEVAVLAAESSSAAAIRQAVAEGRVGRDELVRIGQNVIDEILSEIDDEARRVLTDTVSDVRHYIERLVEAQLERLKGQGIIPRVGELADPKSSAA